ncbi:Origin recognition complex, subunit 1 [Orbilia oligospora]|nr:Origin recognition complex, subunit 1 [Orbilia oligospora]KAF3258493.1 Origin recognition complex, subunit 1 [Orbilia oligospora]KAF3271175.1 Origin recognition complex, subunit 1 [Orbilia oligospora]KAF3282152.1 Origin recognition complex, subunit 1 [Orbilia oligospora]
MPGRTRQPRAASQRSRLNQLLRGQTQKAAKGQIEREDSDDELGDEDIPWTWIYPDNGPLSPVSSNKAPAGSPNAKKRRRDGSPVNQSESIDAKPIGAKIGTFECRVGDAILLKAEGQKAAWVGLAVDFDTIEDEMRARIMWFSNHSEIRNRTKKRTDHLPNELYITPTFDWNPVESINGKAEVLSEKAFKAEFPNGVPAKSPKKGKVFLCRRACDVRPARYSEEFDWDDLYYGETTDLEKLKDWVKENTSARSSRKSKDTDFEMHVDSSEGEEDGDFDEGASGEDELKAPRTPRKNKKRRRSVTTPRAKPAISKKLLTPSHRKITAKKALTFTPLSLRTLSPATHLASPYQIARNRLHVSSVPDSLPCRETEFGTVYAHLHDAITTGSGSCIYISGTPGTGKTATVREVIAQLQVQVEEEEIEDFIFLEINGMKITDPHQSYSLLWEAIQGDSEGPARVAPNHALNLLEREFSTPSPRRVPIVVLMDELDQLVTKNQSVMYNFFNWPSMTHSRLIVLAVANTMDLPERTLSNKISSRLGLTRITFPGYTHEQLKKIIESRLEGVPGNIVQPDAIQFAARKVAAVSGDARRALDICRRAVELIEQTNSDVVPPTPSKSGRGKVAGAVVPGPAKVTIQTVIKAINEATHSPLQMYLKSLPLSAKVLLAAILGRMRRSGVNENIMADVIEDAETLVRMTASANVTEALLARDGVNVGDKKEENMFLTPRKGGRAQTYRPGDEDLPRVKGLVSAAMGLAEGGILGLEMGRRGERAGRVRLNIGEEEVKAALKDDPDVGGMGFNG